MGGRNGDKPSLELIDSFLAQRKFAIEDTLFDAIEKLEIGIFLEFFLLQVS